MTTASSLYGRSLYDLAKEEGLSEEILSQMKTVGDILRDNPEYVSLLSEPSIPMQERLSLVDKAFSEDLQPYLLNFMKILLERGMLRGYQESYRMFRKMYNEDHSITDALVISAVPLTDDQREKLKGRLEQISGKTVIMKERLDEKVLGGIRIEMDGRTLDGTVSGRLSALRKKVKEVVL